MINPDGEGPDEQVRCITPEELKKEVKTGVVSEGKTQEQIDKRMQEVMAKHPGLFEGMGRAKTEPIHIKMKENVAPISQGKRQF